MTDFSVWPATNGPNTDAGDASDITRGLTFRLSATGWLKAIRFYRGTTNIGAWGAGGDQPVAGRVFTVGDGQPVAGTDVTFTLSGTGWLVATLAIPVQLNPNVTYRAAVVSKNYTATGGYWNTGAGVGGITNGILTAPDAAGQPSGIGTIPQGSFKQPTTGLEFPTQYFNGGNYWVDVVVSDVDPGSDIRTATGSLALPALGVTASGTKSGAAAAGLPVSIALGSASSKAGTATGSVPAPAPAVAASGSKVGAAPASLPVSVSLSGAAQSSGAGVHAPVSEVLCSAWANFLDVPEWMRDKVPGVGEAQWQEHLMVASELLWMYSGRRWMGGGCTETAVLRSWPPQQGRGSWPYHESWGRCRCWTMPVPVDGTFRHWGAEGVYAIRLPRDPVTDILSVTVGGQAFTEFDMLRTGWVERTDGQSWDVCGGTTEITYTYGEPPPLAGKRAALALALELAKEAIGDDTCRLPRNSTSVTRQGVTVTMLSSVDFQAVYRTGVPEVDRWLAAVNPQSRATRGRVWSPDIPSSVRTPQ